MPHRSHSYHLGTINMGKINKVDRIVVFQPRSGWVCDLGPGSALSPLYNPNEEYFRTGAGTSEAVARSRPLTIPVFDDDKITHLRKMKREGCEIRAIIIGGTHLYWGMDSEINLVEFGGQPGAVSGANVVLNSDLFSGAVYQSNDLLSGIPWECETAETISGTIYFPGPKGWNGPRYVVGSGQSTDETGTLSGSGSPQLEIHFPLEGLQFTLGGSFVGDMKTLDFSGNTLSTFSKPGVSGDETGTIDDGTWKIQINVTSADGRPTLKVTDAGALVSDRVGECVDCSDLDAEAASAPAWSS